MRTLLAVPLVMTLGLSACAGRDNGGTPAVATTGQPAAPGEVVVAGIAYTPARISIAPGGRVTWRFQDNGVAHTVTSDVGVAPAFASPRQMADTFSVTFAAPGTFAYHCEVHKKMHGTVVVG